MKLVPVRFETNFGSDDQVLPIPLGRLCIGEHIGRLFFKPNGKTVLYVSANAVDDGSLVLVKAVDGVLGFGPQPQGETDGPRHG